MYNVELIFTELEALQAAGPDLYASLKPECEELVEQWEWASGPIYRLEPYWFELHRRKRGRKLSVRPENINNQYEYGIDVSGYVVIQRRYIDSGGQTSCEVTLTVYSSGEIYEYVFDSDETKRLTAVKHAFLTRNRIDRLYVWTEVRVLLTSYEYEGDQLTHVVEKAWRSRKESRFTLIYDNAQVLDFIVRDCDASVGGPPSVIYRKTADRLGTLPTQTDGLRN